VLPSHQNNESATHDGGQGRPEAARGRNTGGSGLGLAISKRCIEACGGTVTAQNREGGGLEVVIILPSPQS
jgi:signal transduction histidine kinase